MVHHCCVPITGYQVIKIEEIGIETTYVGHGVNSVTIHSSLISELIALPNDRRLHHLFLIFRDIHSMSVMYGSGQGTEFKFRRYI